MLMIRIICFLGTLAVVEGEIQNLHWMAPFFSGGGYCSEATSYLLALQNGNRSSIPLTSVTIDHHGDGYNRDYVAGLPQDLKQMLMDAYSKPVEYAKSIVVCHSEPGAWAPSLYPTSICPPRTAAYAIGRTMFEVSSQDK